MVTQENTKDQVVPIKFGPGDLEQGFPQITASIWADGNPLPIALTGHLPPAPKLAALYSRMQELREMQRLWGLLFRKLEKINSNQPTHLSMPEMKKLARDFAELFNVWLSSESFSPIVQKLREKLNPSHPVLFLLETDLMQLQKFPWHLWHQKEFPLSEMAFSLPTNGTVPISVPKINRQTPSRILAIFGDTLKIDLQPDRQALEDFPGETLFLEQPTPAQLDKQLRDKQGWDILCFSGHSSSIDGNGVLHLNQTDRLTISELKHPLKAAIQQGLQLAIFNSCGSLALAKELAELNMPQIVVMREPVPDRVAQEFLRHFLRALGRGESLYMAVREAREQLKSLEQQFPRATWLPAIGQNPAALNYR